MQIKLLWPPSLEWSNVMSAWQPGLRGNDVNSYSSWRSNVPKIHLWRCFQMCVQRGVVNVLPCPWCCPAPRWSGSPWRSQWGSGWRGSRLKHTAQRLPHSSERQQTRSICWGNLHCRTKRQLSLFTMIRSTKTVQKNKTTNSNGLTHLAQSYRSQQ